MLNIINYFHLNLGTIVSLWKYKKITKIYKTSINFPFLGIQGGARNGFENN
jgi:hypothetical protein